ncbi:MAG: ATP synthase F1 subunit gamma [Caldithrix sp. RBG_13_44_9]|nr:MAG: ATP synthase F1 subunit gamma [Caldithrix sp. RBG_13_44_9]
MATLREIRRRINSIKSTQQITRAMKMVAAAKLRKAQESILAARPYARKIDEMIRHLIVQLEISGLPLLAVRPPQRVTLVVVTGDRGLCGSFNSNIIKKVLQQIETHRDKEVSLVCIGKKGYDFFRKRGYQIDNKYIQIFNQLEYLHAQQITEYMVEQYIAEKTDLVEVVYNEFKNAVQQFAVVEKYLPLTAEEFEGELKNVSYLYEPDKLSLLNALLPKHLNLQTWRILLESNAAEQGARMTAMENATENASEIIDDLTLHYNKTRQAAITKEISEIVGGAEALKSA